MRKMQIWRYAQAAVLLVFGDATLGRADEFAIKSFDGTGRLTFNEITTAATYRVEWAPSPRGPWTNFTAAAALDEIVAKGSGIVTCTVPMCYRVVAMVGAPLAMVQIPAGINSGTDSEYGFYSVTNATAFYMDTTEVAKAKWDNVYTWAVANGYGFDNAGGGKAPNHPVHTVNWYDCVKWCNARSQQEGLTPCYTVSGATYKTGQSEPDCNFAANGYRLPTGSEWEFAARGGAYSTHFPWIDGNTIQHSRANYYSDSDFDYDTSPTRGYHPTYNDGTMPYTSPVGSFAANGYGLYDMAGNVQEWCWDMDKSGQYRENRGGSWMDVAIFLFCGNPGAGIPTYSCDAYGFRTVCR